MRKLVFAISVIGLLALASTRSEAVRNYPELTAFPEVAITEGSEWPGFYLPDLDGKALSVQDYRGKKIVLHIFASW